MQNSRQNYPQPFFAKDTQLLTVPVPIIDEHPEDLTIIYHVEADILTGKKLRDWFLRFAVNWGHFHYAQIDGAIYFYGIASDAI